MDTKCRWKMGSGWIVAAVAMAGISVAGFALRQCARAMVCAVMERCRRRTITETASALDGGGVVVQCTAEGSTLMVVRPVVPRPAESPPVERILDVGGVVDGELVDDQVDAAVIAEAAR